ncbi:mitogen-activated protein kinase kinase kinase 3-like [Asparagus officinalis]|uniref:mitogen-activated protein kinase kinase kinase 3-like n=1 Tax=Asparagus officinalis TaxID=4686 RepID=UPI00098E029F|nr:mitogen-activated protein kinase kinase kinase 3-like [Asparagus officinalis]
MVPSKQYSARIKPASTVPPHKPTSNEWHIRKFLQIPKPPKVSQLIYIPRVINPPSVFLQPSVFNPKWSGSQAPPSAVVAAKSVPASKSSLLQREESVLNELKGCNQIVSCSGRVSTFHVDGGELCSLLLEYIPRGSLDKLLPLSEFAARRHARSILEGLRFIHGKGYVHCDIKPENILVSGDGGVKIADFGLAKRRGEKAEHSVLGTPLYMAPESIRRDEYEAPIDIWALGCVVSEVIMGRPAWSKLWKDDNVWSLMRRIGFGGELPEIPSEMSGEGKDFLMKCLDRDPATRWTAGMLLEHPFVENLAGGLDSPRSVFGLLRCDDENYCDDPPLRGGFSASTSYASLIGPIGPRDRVKILATEESPNWSRSSSWISVRGGCFDEFETEGLRGEGSASTSFAYSSSSTCDLVGPIGLKERIGLLAAKGRPDRWCNWCCTSENDGWISVRKNCNSEFCECAVLKECKCWGSY